MAVYRGYCRVSTKDQGLTLTTQEKKHKDNSEGLGLDLVLYIEKESGRTEENRKEFQRLISESEKGDYAGFVDVERFGRDVENNAGTYKILKKKGVMIQVAGIIYDPDSPAHKALFDMQSVFAEYIAESNKQKSKDEMMKMKQNGDWPFSGNLLGYKIIRTGKKSRKVEVYQKEADLVKYIFKRYSEGDIAYLKLAKELEIQGLTNRFGKTLAETQVREAINRPIYMGYYILETTGRKREHVLHDLNRDNLVKSNLYSQIIADTQEEAEELWWKCQHIARTTIRVHETPYTARLTAHALSGLIRCDNCKVGTVYANDLKAYTIHYCKCRGYNLKTFKDPFFEKLFEQLFYMSYLFKDSIKEIIDKEKINIESMKMDHQLRIRQIEIEKREIKKRDKQPC
jgi:site-specific DNA recombinase